MFEGQLISAILLMGGVGKRFGSDTPKQFHLLGGKKVFLYALEAMMGAGIFDEIILVCHAEWMGSLEVPVWVKVIEGGKTRQESSYKGILEAKGDIVLIHDAVRPFVSEEILRENVREAIRYGAVDTCIASADTLVYAPGGEKIDSIPKREEFLRGQTPQTFRRDWILEAHENGRRKGIENASDDCRLILDFKRPVQIVRGNERNMKITTDLDLIIAETALGIKAGL